MGGSASLREALLCSGGDGESDQRAATVLVCRSYVHALDQVEPAATVVFVGRVRGAFRAASAGSCGHRIGVCTLRHHPSQAAQGGSADPSDRAQGLGPPIQLLPLRSAVASDGAPIARRSPTAGLSLPLGSPASPPP